MNGTAFIPTHVVPDGGLDARSQPDPNQAPVARLDPRLEVEVLRTWGAWAEIVCSNGWSAWVDARVLVPASPPRAAPAPPPPPPPAAPVTPAAEVPTAGVPDVPTAAVPEVPPAQPEAPSLQYQVPPAQYAPTYQQAAPDVPVAPVARRLPVPAIAGAAAAAIGSFVAWIRGAGLGKGTGFDVPIKFLVDYKTSSSGGIEVGHVVLAAAIVGGVLAVLPGKGRLQRVCGWVCVLVACVYMAQMQRLLSKLGGGQGILDTVGLGAYLAAAGGLVLALAPGARD